MVNIGELLDRGDHAALSMEAKLCVMEYKEGSRSHGVQEDAIFKDSCIRVFTADRAVLYETIEKAFKLFCRMVVSRCITMRSNECSATWLWEGETGCIPVAI